MKNIHVLPTDKPSRLYSYKSIELYLHSENVDANSANLNCKNQNIYITNLEEIKNGDWFLNTLNNQVNNCDDLTYEKNVNLSSWCKKIILTTDQDLITDGVEQISEDTLLKIIKHINSGKNIESFDEL